MMLGHYFVCIVSAVSICLASIGTTCQRCDGLIDKPCKCCVDKVYGGVKVDCSKLNLNVIPEAMPRNTTTLLLNHNAISKLTRVNFRSLYNLRVLDLSSNYIQAIDETAFHGLSNLLVLNLSSNHLPLDSDTYKPNLFRAFKALRVLRIEDNNRKPFSNDTYPDQSFRPLTSLKELRLDGLPGDFGPEFAQLRNLTRLSLSGEKMYCHLPVLRNETFVNVPNVQHLNINNCNVKNSELLTFTPLKHIKTIDVSNNRNLGFSRFSNATFGLQSSPIEVLKMNNIHPEYDVCTRLEISHITHLQHTSLKSLHVDGNGIINIQPLTISLLPRSLEFVSARENKFQYGIYMMETLGLPSLKYVDVSGINKMKPLPFLKRHATRSFMGFNLSLMAPVPVPPKLETLIASDCSFSGKITPGGVAPNNLKTIIVSKNFFSALYGPVTGFEKVEHFDFSSNVLEEINYEYFAEGNSISNLSLANNFLGRAIGKDTEGNLFSKLTKTRVLDISNNRINSLPQKVFIGLVKVETINLSDNFLETFHVDLSQNKKLSLLDLSGNKLQMLAPMILKELEHVSRINLQNNPILCSCGSLDFLKWIQDNMHRIYDVKHLTCTVTTSETKRSFRDLAGIIKEVEIECHSHILVVSVTSVFLFVLGVALTSICYRHRWKLRYLYHVGRGSYRRHLNIDDGDDDTYQYDVFVSYAEPDRRFVIDAMMPELETKGGLNMCIHDRDFIPGDVIATTIVKTIQNSRYTLFLLSPSFLRSEWCEFEYQMARLEAIQQRRNIVLVVLYKYVPLKDLPKDMAIMLRNNCYLEYNEEEFGSVVFWERLVEAIKSQRQPL